MRRNTARRGFQRRFGGILSEVNMQGSWEAAVVASLRSFKQDGHGFDWSWRKAMKLHPPSRRDKQRIDPWGEMSLLDQNVLDDPSPAEFFKAACQVAWFGEKPDLAKFSIEMLVADPSSEFRPAHDGAVRLAA